MMETATDGSAGGKCQAPSPHEGIIAAVDIVSAAIRGERPIRVVSPARRDALFAASPSPDADTLLAWRSLWEEACAVCGHDVDGIDDVSDRIAARPVAVWPF